MNYNKSIIVDDSTKLGRAFDLFIQVLILLSLVSFSIETLPNLSEGMIDILNVFEVTCVSIFTIEYILRVLFSKRLSYIFTFYGIIDVVAILPFYLSTGIDLRSRH